MIKRLLKSILLLLARAITFPLVISYYLLATITDKNAALSSHAQFLSLFPGICGSYLRKAFFNLTLNTCQTNIFIGFGTIFSQQNTSIGRSVYIGPQCNIGQSDIGDQTLIGSGVHIVSGRHQHGSSTTNLPFSEQQNQFSTTRIGNNCWIGNGAIIMANVGENSVIGAGAVVVKDIPANSVAVGNPAKVVKQRQLNP